MKANCAFRGLNSGAIKAKVWEASEFKWGEVGETVTSGQMCAVSKSQDSNSYS